LREPLLNGFKQLCLQHRKPIAVSFFAEKRYVEDFKRMDKFPVFTNPEESVRALGMLRDYRRRRPGSDTSGND
jgi:hypothetical protein